MATNIETMDYWLWMEGIPACLQMEGVKTFNEMQADLTKSEVMNATWGPKNRPKHDPLRPSNLELSASGAFLSVRDQNRTSVCTLKG